MRRNESSRARPRVHVARYKSDLGAEICGADLGAKICGSEVGAKICGAEVGAMICGSTTCYLGARLSGADP